MPATRRTIEIAWRYTTDSELPPCAVPDFRSREDSEEQVWDYSFRDQIGNMIRGRATEKQIEMHETSHWRRVEGTPNA